ncbi:hypothetical protein AAC387_Pa02g4961 [Persea americana]
MEHLGVRKGAWTEEEDILLRKCIEKFGEGKWRQIPFKAGLRRCHKSCRLRWLTYLKPGIKRGEFVEDEVDLIIRLHKLLGNKWSLIAGRLPGRTSNDVKNYWNCHLSRRLTMQKGAQSQIKSINTTTANAAVATKIIMPKPHSFSPNSKWLSGAGPSTIATQVPKMSNNPMLESPQEESTVWWKSLLAYVDQEDHTWWPKSTEVGQEKDLLQSFVAEEMEMMGKDEDKATVENGFGELDNMLLDVDLWGLFET